MGSCFSRSSRAKDVFTGDFLDFDEIIKRHALKLYKVDHSSKKVELGDFDFQINDDKVEYITENPSYRDLNNKKVTYNSVAKSVFNNRSPLEQTYSFEQEKTTKSTVSVRLQQGVALPRGVNLAVKKELLEESQGLPQKVVLTGAVNQEIEEEVRWRVNHQVRVSSDKSANAKLVVEEQERPAVFVVKITVSGNIRVALTRRNGRGKTKGRTSYQKFDVYNALEPYVHSSTNYGSDEPEVKETSFNPPGARTPVVDIAPGNQSNTKKKLVFTVMGKILFRYGVEEKITVEESELPPSDNESSDNED